MSQATAAGLLCLLPALGLWASGLGRTWPARAAAAAAAAAWVAGALLVPGPLARWALAGAAPVAAALYAAFLVARDAREHASLRRGLSERQSRLDQLTRSLEEAKSRSRGIESEQREAQAIYAMVKGLSEALGFEEARPKVELALQQYLKVEEFAFYAAAGPEEPPYPLVRRRLAGSVGASWEALCRSLQEKGLPLTVPHALESPERAVAMPIYDGQQTVGYFYARTPEGADPKALLAKAQTFFEEISFAFGRIRLFQEVEKLSQIDGLTGVYRRGMLDEKIKEEVVRAQTFKTTFCLMLLDIDHFKSLNDRYGHPFGDRVLQKVGAILKGSVYETDFVARYGGEEFAILLPRAESEGVWRKADALRQAVEAAVFELALEQVKITISIGIAHFPRDGNTGEAVLRQADQALYHAKETGRNRVVDIAQTRR